MKPPARPVVLLWIYVTKAPYYDKTPTVKYLLFLILTVTVFLFGAYGQILIIFSFDRNNLTVYQNIDYNKNAFEAYDYRNTIFLRS